MAAGWVAGPAGIRLRSRCPAATVPTLPYVSWRWVCGGHRAYPAPELGPLRSLGDHGRSLRCVRRPPPCLRPAAPRSARTPARAGPPCVRSDRRDEDAPSPTCPRPSRDDPARSQSDPHPSPTCPRPSRDDPARSQTDPDRSQTDPDRSQTDPDRSQTDPDRSQIDPDRSQIDPDRTQNDPDPSNADRHRAASRLRRYGPGPRVSAATSFPRYAGARPDQFESVWRLPLSPPASVDDGGEKGAEP